MSDATEAFSAVERIESGDWDRYMLQIWAAVQARRKIIRAEALDEFERRERIR